MTLTQLRRHCAHKRHEYVMARSVYAQVTRLAVADRTALEHELRDAMLAYYSAHGALHEALRGRARVRSRLH